MSRGPDGEASRAGALHRTATRPSHCPLGMHTAPEAAAPASTEPQRPDPWSSVLSARLEKPIPCATNDNDCGCSWFPTTPRNSYPCDRSTSAAQHGPSGTQWSTRYRMQSPRPLGLASDFLSPSPCQASKSYRPREQMASELLTERQPAGEWISGGC